MRRGAASALPPRSRVVATAACALLAGCTRILWAYPPPGVLPGALDAPEPGEIGAAAGPGYLVFHTVEADALGGDLLGTAVVGLPEDVDLALTASTTQEGPTIGVQAGWDGLDTERLDLAPVIVVGGSYVDLEGGASYLTVAPGLGGRLVYRPTGGLSIPLLVRASQSWGVAGQGIEPRYLPRMAWIEVYAGAVWRPAPALGLGIGGGARWVGLEEHGLELMDVPLPFVTGSIDLRFRGKRPE